MVYTLSRYPIDKLRKIADRSCLPAKLIHANTKQIRHWKRRPRDPAMPAMIETLNRKERDMKIRTSEKESDITQIAQFVWPSKR